MSMNNENDNNLNISGKRSLRNSCSDCRSLYDDDKSEEYSRMNSDEPIVNGVDITKIKVYEKDKDFKQLNCIGSGNFSMVYKGILFDNNNDSDNGEEGIEIAIKKILRMSTIDLYNSDKYCCENGEEMTTDFINEITILQLLQETKSKHILKFYGICLEEDNISIITKYYPNGTLTDYVYDNSETMTVDKAIDFGKQLMEGLKALSQVEPRVIHKDLKPDNILISEEKELVIADFGLSVILSKEEKNIQNLDKTLKATHMFSSPELLSFSNYNLSTDIYSFSLIFYFMITKTEPYQDYSNIVRFKRDIIRKSVRPNLTLSDNNIKTNDQIVSSLKLFFDSTWCQNPENRFSLTEIESDLNQLEVLVNKTAIQS
eukprot:TRINITY_DN2257_c0_g1_i1.p1 TRINITY_DN2257_c0_g1~~TRINITY_DN2257_c0_g1_i1.p1  ORF type:complete len:373 (-),score=77.47 TRINITY_DN2257_c0_g1_i1:153-1271(-)